MGDVHHPDDDRSPDAADDLADDLPSDDDDLQFGLGRGLGAILAGPSAPPVGAGAGTTTGGLSSLFAGTPNPPRPHADPARTGPERADRAGGRPRTGTDPAPPPLPLVPRDERRARVVHPAAAPQRQAVEQRLHDLVAAIDLDVAVHLRPGPGGGSLIMVRPTIGSLPGRDMDALCRAIRAFVGEGRLTTDDFEAAGHHCVAFGPRPLTPAGVYVLGRRDGGLTMDERWALHQRLSPTALPA